MMTKKETKETIAKYFNNFALENGFEQFKKKAGDVEFLYIKEHEYGRDTITINIFNYATSHQIFYGYGKFYNSIEQIVNMVNEKIALNPPYSKAPYNVTLGFRYESLSGLNKIGYLPYVENEAQVRDCVNEIIAFSNKTAFPLLKQMNDIRFLDSEINGEEFWENSWQKRYAFSYFFIQRFIIAKLANKIEYSEFVERVLSRIEEKAKEQGENFNRNDLSMPVPYVLKILENVEPLFPTT